MASGETHDNVGYALTVPVAIAASVAFNLQLGVIVGVSYFIGIHWLSPDLDTSSKPFHRWGFLKVLWEPYQALIPHRGISHWLIIGTLTRVAYLALPVFLLFGWSCVDPFIHYGFPVFIGLELSAITHLFLDGLIKL